jgi:hypothetical protein
MSGQGFGPPVRMGDESIMSPKAHGTSATPVQEHLRWGCDTKVRLCFTEVVIVGRALR